MGTRIKTLQESVAETSQRRQQVEDAIQYLQNYMNTYTDQVYYRDYSDETIVKDVLYGLGIALWGQAEHRGPSGFDRTVARIQEILAKHR